MIDSMEMNYGVSWVLQVVRPHPLESICLSTQFNLHTLSEFSPSPRAPCYPVLTGSEAGSWVAALGAGVLLDVVRRASTATAQRVRLIVALSKA